MPKRQAINDIPKGTPEDGVLEVPSIDELNEVSDDGKGESNEDPTTEAAASSASEPPVPVAGEPGLSVTAIPASTLTGQVMITVPVAGADVILNGYLAQLQSVNMQFYGDHVQKFRRLIAGLRAVHAEYRGPGNRMIHVDSAADALRWLMDQLPD